MCPGMPEFLPSSSPGDAEPTDLVCVGTYRSPRQADEHGLVILAMGLPYWGEEGPEGYGVLVEAAQAPAVRMELSVYDEANAHWPPPPVTWPKPAVARPWLTPLLWAGVVLWAYQAQLEHWNQMIGWGALDARAVLTDDEWWRPATALFLHADLAHLAGNLVLGVFVFANVVAAVGVVRAWWDLAVTAYLANVLTVLVRRGSDTISYGASTAIFAGLGWLTGHAVRVSRRSGAGWRARTLWMPLAAGVALLGWLGGGGGDPGIDVVAHVAGFLTGLVGGALRSPRRRQS